MPKDTEIYERAKVGDSTVMAAVIEKYGEMLFAVARRLDRDEAEDLVQHTVMVSVSVIGKLKEPPTREGSIGVYLRRTLQTMAQSKRRQRRRFPTGLDVEAIAGTTTGKDPIETIVGKERLRMVKNCFSKLTVYHQYLYVRRCYQRRTLESITTELNGLKSSLEIILDENGRNLLFWKCWKETTKEVDFDTLGSETAEMDSEEQQRVKAGVRWILKLNSPIKKVNVSKYVFSAKEQLRQCVKSFWKES